MNTIIRINKNNTCIIENENDVGFLWSLDRELSFAVQGAEHTRAYKGYFDKDGKHHQWDGMRRLLGDDLSFPIGLLRRVEEFYKSNEKDVNLIDTRPEKSPTAAIDIIPALKSMGKEPYPYQIEAASIVKTNDHGIIRLATGGGKCVQETDICLTNNGMLMIGEIGENLSIGEYKELVNEVASPLVEFGIEKTSHIYRDGPGYSRCYKTTYGFTSTATPAHQIKVLSEKGNIVWKKVSELKKDDVVVLSLGQKMFGNNDSLSFDEAYFIGLITGDGTWTEKSANKNTVILTNQDDHILKFFAEYSKNKNLTYDHNTSVVTKECYIINKQHASWLRKHLDPNISLNKSISKSVRQSPKEIVAAFIRGLYETDGWVGNEKSKPTICIGLSSKKLIDQLHVILLNFGIVASRRIKKTSHNDSHILTIYRDFIPKFIQEIGFDPNGHKFAKLNKVMEKMKDVSHNTNTDIIPCQENKLRRLKEIIKKTHKVSIANFFIDSHIKASVFRSWTDTKAWRKPSRDSLKKLVSLIQEKFTNKDTLSVEARAIAADIEYLCSDQFYYDCVESIQETFSDNYDFVVPDTHSFVSQGFINHNTMVSALMTAHLGKRTILYVIGKDLLYQTHKFFSSVFNHKIGIIGDGNCDIQDINVASVWTVGQALGLKGAEILTDAEEEGSVDPNKYKEIRQMLLSSKVHIFDECHLAACNTIQEIAKNINPEHIYGMSASPWRDDNADLLIECVLGKNIVDISASYLIEHGFLVKPIIKFLTVPPPTEKLKKAYQTIYKNYITDNPVRNGLVVRGAEKLVEQGYQTLVLYNNVVHGNLLYQEISKKFPCILLSGKDSSDVRETAKKRLENYEVNCIIASKIFDIGVDLPSLSGLIIAGGGKSSVRALQRIGRVIRKYPGKKQAAIVDFYDQAPFLKDHSNERRKIYSTEKGFEVIWPKK